MNLEDLRAAQVDERGTDSLQPLPPSFYEQAADYLADLRERRDLLADRVDDPFDSDEVRQLTDELETAEEVVEAIYERRVGKLVKRASLAAAGVPTDEEGLTDEECELFADLVDRIERHRGTVLDVLEGEEADRSGASAPPAVGEDERADAGSGSQTAPPDAVAEAAAHEDVGTPSAAAGDDAESASDAAPEPPADGEPESDGGPGAAAVPSGRGETVSGRGADPASGTEAPADEAANDAERVTVRLTADVGEIYGVDDRVYTLGDEDVVTLPSANAEPLLDRGAAQRVE